MNNTAPRRPPAFLMAMTVLAIVSLGLGVVNQIGQQKIQTSRNQDRIDADVQSCERGNVLRKQLKASFSAVDEAVNGILDASLSTPRPGAEAATAAYRARIAGPLGKLHTAADAIAIVDCSRVVPGALNG